MRIKMIKEATIGKYGLSVRFFKNNSYPMHPYTVQIIDSDTNETIETRIFPSYEMAETAFNYNANK